MADETPHIFVEPPVPTTTEFGDVEQVRAVIAQLDRGSFRMPALLVERLTQLQTSKNTLRDQILAEKMGSLRLLYFSGFWCSFHSNIQPQHIISRVNL